MDITGLRAKFKQLSGRTDLVNADGSDNGANFYINAGQRMLDLMQDTPENTGIQIMDLKPGEYSLALKRCRTVLSVWASDSSAMWQLTHYTEDELRAFYQDSYDSISRSKPLYWALSRHSLSPEQAFLQPVAFTGATDTGGVLYSYRGYNSLLLLPPADKVYTIRIHGKWFTGDFEEAVSAIGDVTFSGNPSDGETISVNGTTYTFKNTASADTDIAIASILSDTIDNAVSTIENKDSALACMNVRDNILRIKYKTAGTSGNSIAFTASGSHLSANGNGYLGGTQLGSSGLTETWWSINYPEVLLHAALYQLEIAYRNMTGAQGWMAAIETALAKIDGDFAEGSAAGITYIAG